MTVLRSIAVLGASVCAAGGSGCWATNERQPGPSQPSGAPAPAVPLSHYTERTIEGFPTFWHPDCGDALSNCREAEAAATEDLGRVKRRVPCAATHVLQTVHIVFSFGWPDVGALRGRLPRYYRSAAWLARHGVDAPRLGAVEIADIEWYTANRWIQPAVLLHELAHAYAERAGARDRVQSAFENADVSGLYATVWARDWGIEQGTAQGYAMTSSDEYFAELSEAYFWTNNWYPFNRTDLLGFDPVGAEMVREVWSAGDAPCPDE